MTQRTKPFFLLGLGAQKAGTTWLHAYASSFPNADFGALKEYHIWDGLTVPEFAEYDRRSTRVKFRTQLRDLRRRLTGQPPRPFLLRRRLQRDPENYFDYFAELLASDGVTLTGDITPSYSALSTKTLAHMRDGFARRGIPTRAVFLMRDPVERCLSAVRMYRRNGVSKQGVDISLSDEAALLAYIASPQARLRTNYHHTLEALRAAFGPDELYVGFYENMFTPGEFDKLSTFLGLPADYDFLTRKFNVTTQADPLDPGARKAATDAFAPVYDYCIAEFPELRDLWKNQAA